MPMIDSSDVIGRAPGRRKLIAVVYADMVGYSRLIGLDDLGTLERLRTLRGALIDPAINEHGGRVVQTGGDSLLIVFDSIDGAARCAIKIQQQVPDYDGDQPSDRVIRFRVGINIGDVIADGTDLHGDGVNVAARLQAECPPGGICVSRAVRDHVHGRLDLVFRELGALSLKNIPHPVEAFLLRLESEAAEPRLISSVPPAIRSDRKAKRPRPSVVVTRLRNIGVPKEHEYLVEVIPEDISAVLPQHVGPIVVVSNVAGQSCDSTSLRDIARELGMVYLIQGSIRAAVEDNIAVIIQLIDVETSGQLWSEQFYITLGTTAGANEITHRMALALSRKINEDVNRRIDALSPEDWTAEDLVIRGGSLLGRPVTFEGGPDLSHQKALSYFEQALAKAPDSIFAKTGIACVLVRNVWNGQNTSVGEAFVRAERLLADVLRVNGQSAVAHNLMGVLRLLQGRLSDSLIEHRLATGLEPNHSYMPTDLGVTLAFLGQPTGAIPLIERGLRLDPHGFYASISHGSLGLCHLLLGNAEEAVISLRTARAMNPLTYFFHWLLAAALGLKGELDEAGSTFRKAIEMKPDLVAQVRGSLMRACPEYITLYEKSVYVGLRRAGLPDIWFGTNERPVGWIGSLQTSAQPPHRRVSRLGGS